MPLRADLAAAAFLAFAAPSLAQEADADARRITVSGTGTARAAPDLAFATLTVQRTGATAREALDDANKAMEALTEGMRQLGIEARDLQTSGFAIQPQYSFGNNERQEPPKLVGYEVRNTLTVRIRDVGRTGSVLDRAVTLGANGGGDVSFAVEDAGALRREARRAAVEDATQTARALAAAANVQLGAVMRLETRDAAPPAPMPMARMAVAASSAPQVPVESGELNVDAEVAATFAIVGGN